MILVLSCARDCHLSLVTARLKELGADYFVFNPADFPTNASLTVEFGSRGLCRRVLRTTDRVVNLDRVTAGWVRRPGKPEAPPQVTDEDHRRWVVRESQDFLDGVWQTMDCLWLPARPRDSHFGYNKTYHLGLAASLGFSIPDHTVVTNDPGEFLSFYEKSGGDMVTKVSSPLSKIRDGEPHHTFTHVVRRRDGAAYHSVRWAPTILQS